MAGISGRKAPKKWLWMRDTFRWSVCNQLSKTNITYNCGFFGINNSFFIRLADFMLNSDNLSLISKRFFHTDFVSH